MTFRTILATWLISVYLKAARQCLELSLWPKARHTDFIINCHHPWPTSRPTFLHSALNCYHLAPISDCSPSPLPSPRGTTFPFFTVKRATRRHSFSICHQLCAHPLYCSSRKAHQISNSSWSTQMCWSHLPSLRTLTPQGTCSSSCIFGLSLLIGFFSSTCCYVLVLPIFSFHRVHSSYCFLHTSRC